MTAMHASNDAIGATVHLGELFGDVCLIDRVNCGDADTGQPFAEGPEGASRVETILGRACRVLPVEGPAKYFVYRLVDYDSSSCG